ncbi:MAG: diguanylate cyclase [Blastocatellia bacterium]|nr:MAG: diguanylate cyclase [Blastocatellia bacterium]
MRTLARLLRLVALAALAIGAGLLLGVAGWLQPYGSLAFSGLIIAAILTSCLAQQPSTMHDPVIMPPSFVIDFASLLLFGPHATVLIATAGIAAEPLANPQRASRRTLVNAGAVLVAIQSAGLVHRALGVRLDKFAWPWQGIPIAAAVVGYCIARSATPKLIVPLVMRQPVRRTWLKSFLRACPTYFIGAGVSVGLVEVIENGLWTVLGVAGVPLYFGYRAYRDYVNRVEDAYRRLEVVESLDDGMSVVDSQGRITLWNDALERILDCPRERALGRSLGDAVPALRMTELPRAVEDVLSNRSARTLAHVGLGSGEPARILQVKLLSVVDGVTLLWHDITEQTRAERALKRSEQRLALAAAGANDGLWEWDLRTRELYFSGRWKSMIGLAAHSSIGRLEDWMDRVHADDLASLKKALDAHLAGRTEHFQHEHRIRHEDGTYRRFLCRGVALRGGAGQRAIRVAGSLTDTTEHAMAQEQIRTAGFVDPLTGLCNRMVFVDRLGQRLEDFKRDRGGGPFAVLYLDLDRFKVVNDSLGHLVGDELLIAVSRRLESCLRQGDAIARLGGDEFAILLGRLSEERQANAIAFRIQDALGAPFSIGGREVFTSASVGIAFGMGQYRNPDEIMRDADTAMYQAKARGKARHEIFDADMHARARDRLELENDLRHAVNSNDFEIHYQPIVSLASGMCIGFESLVRWSRNGEPVSPATFIPIAEELGLIEPIGAWVLQQACQTFADWQRKFPASGLDCITVNVSSRQLLQPNFLSLVALAVDKAGLKPCDLRVEITETALMDSPNVVAEVLHELRRFGVKIYLDDFGTGYSSLSHLHRLPVDALKIDRSFVRSLLLPDRPAIVESILGLARTLNTSVVAEGIETDVQARELERLGCAHAQGYLFSKPLSTGAVEELLLTNRPLGPKQDDTLALGAAAGHERQPHGTSTPFVRSSKLEASAHKRTDLRRG